MSEPVAYAIAGAVVLIVGLVVSYLIARSAFREGAAAAVAQDYFGGCDCPICVGAMDDEDDEDDWWKGQDDPEWSNER